LTRADQRIRRRLKNGGQIWLFLDYDGTLADFAATPDIVTPDLRLIHLLKRLIQQSSVRLTIISGRRLDHVHALVPISGIWLAGTYGIELMTPSGERLERLNYSSIRPILDEIKPVWRTIIGAESSFYLEDKGWTLAIHARFAEQEQADRVMISASQAAKEIIQGSDFRLLGGHRFLEVSPKLADKRQTVEHLLEVDPWQDAIPVYIGDDDKDIRAFPVVQAHGGLALLVGYEHQAPDADDRLESPQQVRAWLKETFLNSPDG
jgi:trehalose 6-phosphate phosphatase